MLLGTYQVKASTGRRVFIPAPLRSELGEKYILAKWYEECLVLVAEESWNALYKRLVGDTKIIVSPIRETERFILGSAYNTVPDDQGRIVIPEVLTNYAKLSEAISFIGLGDRVEIWSSELWEEKQKTLTKEATEIIENLAKKHD
jgi:MraZ protein